MALRVLTSSDPGCRFSRRMVPFCSILPTMFETPPGLDRQGRILMQAASAKYRCPTRSSSPPLEETKTVREML